MRLVLITLLVGCVATPVFAQEAKDGPTNEKAQKTYKEALQNLHDRKLDWALDSFKKADKQDGGHCLACQKQMIKYGVEIGDWKTAELGAEEMAAEAQGEKETALAHFRFAMVLLNEGLQKHKDEYFTRAQDEFTKALAAYANFPDALFADGRTMRPEPASSST